MLLSFQICFFLNYIDGMKSISMDSVDVMVWCSLATNYHEGQIANNDQLKEWQAERLKLMEKKSMSPASFNEVNTTAGVIYQLSTGLIFWKTRETDVVLFRGIAGVVSVFSIYESGTRSTCSFEGNDVQIKVREKRISEKINQAIPKIFAAASKNGQGKPKMPKLVNLVDDFERRTILLKFFDALVGIHYMLMFQMIDENYLPELMRVRRTLEDEGTIVTSISDDATFLCNVVNIYQHASKLGQHENMHLAINFKALSFVISQLHWHLIGYDIRVKPNNVQLAPRTHHTTRELLFELLPQFSQFVKVADDNAVTDA